jgi:hypothetical protein
MRRRDDPADPRPWSPVSHLGALTERPAATSGKLVPGKSRRVRRGPKLAVVSPPEFPDLELINRTRKRIDDEISEELLQRAVIEHLRLRAPKDVVYFHVPNGGKRSKVEGARFKLMGVVAGVPDLVLGRSGRMYAMELKARGGKPSDEQYAVMEWFRAAGIQTVWVDNLDAALEWLARWGMFDRQAEAPAERADRPRMILDPDEEG